MEPDANADDPQSIEWNSWSRNWLEALGAIFLLAGVVFFFAANWKEMSPLVRFGILEAGVVLAVVAALISGIETNPGRWFLGAAAVFTGVLIAVYGQVYQTGADAFEVFALWAVLILAWAAIAKFQPLWLLFLVVAETALLLFGGQVVVPDEIAGWSAVYLGLGIFTGAAWLISQKLRADEWLRFTLVGVTLFWLTLIPWLWIFESSYRAESMWVYLTGTLVWTGTGAGVWWYFSRAKNDFIIPASMPILSVAFIVCCLCVKVLEEAIDEESIAFTLAGLIAIVIFGGSAWLITRIHRQNEKSEVAEQENDSADDEPHWLARFALGAGAWIAGVFLTIAIVAGVGWTGDGSTFAFIGAVLIAVGITILRLGKGLFLQQLGLALSLTGHISLFFGIADAAGSDGITTVLIAAIILCPIVYIISKNSVQRYLSVAWVWLFLIVQSFESENAVVLSFGLIIAVGLIGFGFSKQGRALPWFNPAFAASISGLGGMLFSISSIPSWQDFWTLPFQIIAAMVIGGTFTGLIWYQVKDSNTPLNPGWLVALGAVLIGIGAAGAPGVAASLGLMILSRAVGDRKLEWIAVFALGAFLILFYYFLGVSLLAKSLWLIGIGVGVLILRTFIPSKISPSNALAS